MSELITVSVLWAFAVVLYYYAGKKKGYHEGFADGGIAGAKGLLKILEAKRNESKGDSQ